MTATRAVRIDDGHQRAASNLLPLLDHIRLDAHRFRGRQPEDEKHQVFGGQVLAQALAAAAMTTESRFLPHSAHAHFLLPGDARTPIDFHVEDVRDGSSYVTREVHSRQHGRDILRLTASFHVAEEPLVEHEMDADPWDSSPAPAPHEVPAMEQRPGFLHPVEIRPVLHDPDSPGPRRMWLRADGGLGESPTAHACAVAYACDLALLTTALLPHRLTPGPQGDVAIASLNHAMWFHRPFRGDHWLLHETDSPIAHGGRALTRGAVRDRTGRLVVSTAQEGAVRAPRR